MPKGVPVGTLAIGPAGAANAGLLAAAMLATTDAALAMAQGARSLLDVDVAIAVTGSLPIYDRRFERALKIGDELGGHIVAGHADGIATIVKRDDLPDMARFELRTTRELARFIASKGSITLDGVSLTVNEVTDQPDGSTHFAVNIIPHTAAHTTLGDFAADRELNLEIDVIARYLKRMGDARPS